jgi:peptidyl-lysine (3S)-dioxygenase / protease
VEAGDVVFVPSFWWHEVASAPGPVRRAAAADTAGEEEEGGGVQLNVAINYWFDPLFLKEYPCATCKKYVNKKYGSMLLEHYK